MLYASPETTAIVTIIAKNYLAFARTLMQSAKTHQPNWRRVVILVDEPEGKFDINEEDFEVIELSNLPLRQLQSLRFK